MARVFTNLCGDKALIQGVETARAVLTLRNRAKLPMRSL